MKTKVLLGKDARDALRKGMTLAHEPVARSMGARGRNTVFTDKGVTQITNDGITIINSIDPEDEFEAQGVDLIRQASAQTNSEAGDGTSATVVLSVALIDEGLKQMEKGKNPMIIRRELEEGRKDIISLIDAVSKKITDDKELLSIAKISVEDEKIAKVIVDSVKQAGKYGAVLIEEGAGYEIERIDQQGYYWNRGFISPYMITNPERREAILMDAPILITDKAMNLHKELVPFIDTLHANGIKSLFLVADNVEGELLQTLINNKLKGIFTVVAVKRPATVEELEDLAILTGGTAVTKEKGIQEFKLEHLGKVQRVMVGAGQTVIIGQKSEKLVEHIKQISDLIKDDPENESLKKRMGMLAGGMVKLIVGGRTEGERSYVRRKIEDGVCAVNAAIDGGIVPGGGSTLYEISEKLDNPILKAALKAPHTQILRNAGFDEGTHVNVLTGKKITDHLKEGIVDPAKVVKAAISNAISVAGIFLTTEAAVVDIPNKTKS